MSLRKSDDKTVYVLHTTPVLTYWSELCQTGLLKSHTLQFVAERDQTGQINLNSQRVCSLQSPQTRQSHTELINSVQTRQVDHKLRLGNMAKNMKPQFFQAWG